VSFSAITATNLVTGRNGAYREHFAQVGDVGVFGNGHDKWKVFQLRTGNVYDLGIAAPGALGGVSSGGAGNVKGAVRYRGRWYDQYTNTMSLPGTETSFAATGNSVNITQPGSAPGRATHFIVERTTAGGSSFFPVNRSFDSPNGTALGSTCADNLADNLLRNRALLNENQGIPKNYRFCEGHGGFLWLGGGRKHRVPVQLTASNAAVSAVAGGFNQDMVGQDLAADGDTDGKSYRILSVSDSNNLTLAANYAGSTGVKNVTIAGVRDYGANSEADSPEHFGSQEVGFCSNEYRIGSDGEALVGGCGFGRGGFLWAKETMLYAQFYSQNPNPIIGDGVITAVPVRRGALSPLAIKSFDGRAYGIDYSGIWSMAPGGIPEEIGQPFRNDWISGKINFEAGDNFYISEDPFRGVLLFHICEETDRYPGKVLVWDLERRRWIDSKRRMPQSPCGVPLPDDKGAYRFNFFTTRSGSVKSYMWTDEIGFSAGAAPSTTPLYGQVDQGATDTEIPLKSATLPTSGDKLKGVALRIIRASNGQEEERIISDNTATTPTVSAAFSFTPAENDEFRIAPLMFVYRSGRLDAGQPERKKKWKWLWVRAVYKTACVPFVVKVYYDGSTTPDSNHKTFSQNGVTATEAVAGYTVNPTTANQYRFQIPLNNRKATTIEIEITQNKAGQPFELMELKLDYDDEDRESPTGK